MIRRVAISVLVALALFLPRAAPALPDPAANGAGDAIFAVGDDGFLTPVAVRLHGAFVAPGSNEGGSPARLQLAANAAIGTHGNHVHVIFGGRTVATVPATVHGGNATATVPPALHLGGMVSALASPTLDGHASAKPRRAPTAAERRAALALAAKAVGGVAPAALTVRNLTAIDLGRGMAIVGTINLRGSGAQRIDHRLFFIAEPRAGALRTTLSKVQTIHVTEPLLEEAGEVLVDAIDVGDGALSVVTNEVGYDANTYAIYSRTTTGWHQVYGGGGAAL